MDRTRTGSEGEADESASDGWILSKLRRIRRSQSHVRSLFRVKIRTRRSEMRDKGYVTLLAVYLRGEMSLLLCSRCHVLSVLPRRGDMYDCLLAIDLGSRISLDHSTEMHYQYHAESAHCTKLLITRVTVPRGLNGLIG